MKEVVELRKNYEYNIFDTDKKSIMFTDRPDEEKGCLKLEVYAADGFVCIDATYDGNCNGGYLEIPAQKFKEVLGI